MNPTLVGAEEIAEARREVQKILASKEFEPSRQLRDFLQYVSEAALEGRTHLEQIEIAERVLKRGKEFSPLDDASVRKLGTALRQRLQRYYETDGVDDPVRVTLPVRSYIPVFELRSVPVPPVELPAAAITPPPPIEEPPPSRRWILAAGGIATLSVVGGSAAWWARHQASAQPGTFVIHTRRGDIMHEVNDIAPDAILLGPKMGEASEITARMLFTPTRATQQAGLIIYNDADQYIKFGRQFLARPQLEFGLESKGRYTKPPGTFAYDPESQNGEPVWLTIRRDRGEYRAFASTDGTYWRPFGNVLNMPEPMPDARAAVFAHNGRSNAPSAEARFDHVGVGLSFHNRPQGAVDLNQFAGWRTIAVAGMEPHTSFDGECLVVDTSPSDSTRGLDFVQPAPQGDWTLVTRVDFLSMNGSTAGLTAIGPQSRFRLIRWDLDGGSITAEHLGSQQFNVKDAEGAPPVTLRMVCRSGRIRCSFSRDNRQFQDVPLEVPVKDITSNNEYEIGLHVSTSSWRPGDPRLPARFYYVRRELDRLEPRAGSKPAKS